MRVVDDQAGLVLTREAHELVERRDVPIHGKDALAQDEFRAVVALMLGEKGAEMACVAMAVADLPRTRRLAAEMHAGVIEAVGEDERLGAKHASIENGLERGGVGLEARRHDERGLLALEARELGLDRAKQLEISGDEARGSRSHAPFVGPLDRPADQGLVEAKPEIVVAGEIDVSPALGVDRPRLARGDSQQEPPQALLGALIEKGPVPCFASDHALS